MQTFNQNIKYIQIKRIKDSIEWNECCADQLVTETTTVVTKVCQEWALSKFKQLDQLVESSTISKHLLLEIPEILFTLQDWDKVLGKIAKMLHSSFEEYDMTLPTGFPQIEINLDLKRSENYWQELSRTSIILDLVEEVKQNCWSMVFGDFPGWFLGHIISNSGNYYSHQQSDLKTLLLKQINGILTLAEQKIINYLLNYFIQDIYQQFDQREERLSQRLHTLQRADAFTEAILSKVC